MTEDSPNDSLTPLQTGTPTTVPVPISCASGDVVLVTRNNNALLVVGLQFLLEGMIIAAWKLEDLGNLGSSTIANI